MERIDCHIKEFCTMIAETGKREDGLSGLSSGFNDLDKITNGWQNGDLIIIASRPAMGKTAFVLSMVKNMAVDKNIPVVVFSLEMSNIQLVNRLLMNVTESSDLKINTGQLDKVLKNLKDAPIYIDTPPRLSIQELCDKAKKEVEESGVKAIFIDYIQRLTVTNNYTENRYNEINYISRELKSLARELNIPIFAISQLNRNVENEKTKYDILDSKKPKLTDLRDSGTLCDDADIVCFIFRPEYYKIYADEHGNDLTGKAEINIAKNRNGYTGDIMLDFKKEYCKFQEPQKNSMPEEFQSKFNSYSDNKMPF